MEHREDQIDPAHQKTFEWIFSDDTTLDRDLIPMQARLRAWFANGESLFWVSGKAASGKSTLMKYAYHHDSTKKFLSQGASPDDLVMASFFFLERSQVMLQKSKEGMLRALIHQILWRRKELCDVVLGRFLEKFQHIRGSMRNHAWILKDLEEMFEVLLRQASPNFHIFVAVDGLDEYWSLEDPSTFQYSHLDEDERCERAYKITKGHLELADMFRRLARLPYVKFCLSSRPLNAFRDAFVNYGSIKLEDLTIEDISTYVETRLGGSERFAELLAQLGTPSGLDIQGQIISEIVKKASGVFLWVRLVVDRIIVRLRQYGTLEQVKVIIETAPSDLKGRNGLYARMLETLSPLDLPRGNHVFLLLLRAEHTLSVYELWCITNSQLEHRSLDRIARPTQRFKRSRERNLEGQLEAWTAGLVEVLQVRKNTGRIVQFLHQSVKEFLEDRIADGLTFDAGVENHENPFTTLMKASILQVSFNDIKLNPRQGRRVKASMKNSNNPLIMRCFQYAQLAEESTGRAHVDLVKILDRVVLNCIARRSASRPDEDVSTLLQDVSSGGRHWAGCLLGDTHLDAHGSWSNDHRDDLYSLAVEYKLELFLRAEIRAGYAVTSKRGRPLLSYATGPVYTRFQGIGAHQAHTHIVQLLLKYGPYPNRLFKDRFVESDNVYEKLYLFQQHRDISVWTNFLVLGCMEWHHYYSKKQLPTTTDCWNDIAKLMIEHGANVNKPIKCRVFGSVHRSKVLDAEEAKDVSPLFIAMLRSWTFCNARTTLLNLMFSMGARLLPGEKRFARRVLGLGESAYLSWIPNIVSTKEWKPRTVMPYPEVVNVEMEVD